MDVPAYFSLTVLLLIGMTSMMAEGRPSTQNGRIVGDMSIQSNGCACDNQTDECGCCAHIKFDVLHVKVDDDACVNITYLPEPTYGLSLTFSWNGKIIFNQTVSARNPPPFCFGVPHVKLLRVCIRLYNISFDKEHFGGCIALQLGVFHFKKEFELGCIYKTQLEHKTWYLPRDTLTPRDILRRMFADKMMMNLRRMLYELREHHARDMLDHRSHSKENKVVFNSWNQN